MCQLNYNRAKILNTFKENESVNCAIQKYISLASNPGKVSDFKKYVIYSSQFKPVSINMGVRENV